MQDATIYLAVGILVILAAWIPLFLGRIPVSLPIIAVAIGIALAAATGAAGPYALLNDAMRKLAEFALLVAVLGGGLKLDRRFSFATWASTWRLLGPVMLISIVAVAAAAYFMLGVPLGLAIVIGALLAPTDPVLAADYAAGPPGKGEEGEVKFALTSEAGLNDGFAFPFISLGLLIAAGNFGSTEDVLHWLGVDLVWNICAGAAIGAALGWALVTVNGWLPVEMRLSSSNSGLVAVGLAFLAYAAASYVGGNGFVAVFCEAVAIRNLADVIDYSRRLNHTAEQFERVAMVLVLTVLGVSVMSGLFVEVGWTEIAFAAVVLLPIRPLAVFIGFIGSPENRWTRATLGYFGIRGIASLYYAADVAPMLGDQDAHRIVAVIGVVIVGSVVLYGTTAHRVGKLLGGPDAFEE